MENGIWNKGQCLYKSAEMTFIESEVCTTDLVLQVTDNQIPRYDMFMIKRTCNVAVPEMDEFH